ncbi:hypothetical protein DCC85_06975 [Paenibacillus sp. CAA11]|uniref:type VII toxin-antitoxin system MntA family adenylyltransferase antitoxin n=1 Tax=Paenibacillus sp. CAA11 TaxID=1532905 RepID=UPI000D3A76A7|nr:nucleotidyltransferase domain-containing protein [Paenibacillus sp. CAA11]AWB43989.1 hypothetical protein DCC85_06975 [Paenibacillus sp. CAA11]
MNGLTPEEKTHIVRYLVRHFRAYSIILFGSAAQASLRQDSNVDIAYLTDSSPAPEIHTSVKKELEQLLCREVALVNFAQAAPFYKTQIVSGGKLLYDQRPLDRQYILKKALKDYVLQAQG